MKLSIVIPVYNEVNTILKVIESVRELEIEKEIVVVDDNSQDGTRNLLEKLSYPDLKVIFHDTNKGKGAALRTGFNNISGDIVVIQDADLEYDPNDLLPMLELINNGVADVVYGSRFYGNPHRVLLFYHYMGNRLISFLINLLFNLNLTDIEVGYKMFKSSILKDLTLRCDDFGFEVEFTAKIAKLNYRIYEIGISYYGRTYEEGKKINWKDGIKAHYYIFRFRFFN